MLSYITLHHSLYLFTFSWWSYANVQVSTQSTRLRYDVIHRHHWWCHRAIYSNTTVIPGVLLLLWRHVTWNVFRQNGGMFLCSLLNSLDSFLQNRCAVIDLCIYYCDPKLYAAITLLLFLCSIMLYQWMLNKSYSVYKESCFLVYCVCFSDIYREA